MGAIALLIIVAVILTGIFMNKTFGENYGQRRFDDTTKQYVDNPESIKASVTSTVVFVVIVVGIAFLFMAMVNSGW